MKARIYFDGLFWILRIPAGADGAWPTHETVGVRPTFALALRDFVDLQFKRRRCR